MEHFITYCPRVLSRQLHFCLRRFFIILTVFISSVGCLCRSRSSKTSKLSLRWWDFALCIRFAICESRCVGRRMKDVSIPPGRCPLSQNSWTSKGTNLKRLCCSSRRAAVHGWSDNQITLFAKQAKSKTKIRKRTSAQAVALCVMMSSSIFNESRHPLTQCCLAIQASYLKTISEKTGVHVVKSPPELNYNQSGLISNHPIFHLPELFDSSTKGERLLLHRMPVIYDMLVHIPDEACSTELDAAINKTSLQLRTDILDIRADYGTQEHHLVRQPLVDILL
ncbi:hypothetical protein L345_01784, partial [Ophiophagus hannah]